MNFRHLAGQLMFIGVAGESLTADEKKFIVENNIGGICLFGRNVKEPKQVRELCEEIQSLRHQQVGKTPLFIGIDMEGGRVHRLKPPFTTWPALKKLGDLDAPTVSFHFAHRMGRELSAVGINLDFAPCVDILTNPLNTVIGDRSLSSDPEMVAKHASALIRGYMKSDIITCAKHFPGHGNTIVDSHEDLPVENADRTRLEACELIPFKKSIKARCDFIMTSHIKFPQIDPNWPVTLSEVFIQEILRKDLRYRGLIITDDLGMKAMTKHYGLTEVPVRALRAGVDVLLYCNDPEVPPLAIEAVIEALAQKSLNEAQLRESYDKVLQLKADKIKNAEMISKEEMISLIGHPENMRIASAIASNKIPEGLLPE